MFVNDLKKITISLLKDFLFKLIYFTFDLILNILISLFFDLILNNP